MTRRTARTGRTRARWMPASLLLVAAVLTGVALPGTAAALWQASSSPAPTTVRLGVVTAPGQPSCANTGTLTRSAVVSWTAVAAATGYRVTVRNADSSVAATTSVTGTSITISSGLLNSLISGLFELLLGGGTWYVSVQTVHPTGWVSAASPTARIGPSLTPLGVACD